MQDDSAETLDDRDNWRLSCGDRPQHGVCGERELVASPVVWLGRKLIMQDVMNLEILVRDVMAIYAAWTR